MNTLPRLQAIFNEIQTCNSKKFTEDLTEVLELIPADSSFLRIIDSLLVSDKAKLPPKVTYFLKRVLEEQSQANKIIYNTIFLYLVDKIDCKSTKVRRNSLRCISLMIAIDQSYGTKELLEKTAERLFDKEQSVRKEALKICILFQTQFLSDSITIQTTIKDMIRYDQSHEIRKIGFLGLDLCQSTLNCILERCIDSNVQIRKAFWTQYFNKINLHDLDHCQRIYLMKKGINEREFDAKHIFLQKVKELGLKIFIEDFYCEDEEYEICIKDYVKECDEEYELDQYTPSYLNFLCFYYKVKEEKDGRDSLKLIDLENFLQIFYSKCKETEESIANNCDTSNDKLKVLKYLLRIVLFYDLFTDESKKYIYSIIQHLVQQPHFTQIVEDYITLAIKISDEKAVAFIGSLIKKTKGLPICLLICEYAMKHLPYGEFYDAVMNEIVIFNVSASFNIFFWYLMKNPKTEIEKQYLNFLPNKKVLEGATDLVLANIIKIEKIEEVIAAQLAKFNTAAVVPTCKLLLAKKIEGLSFLKNLLIVFYSTEDESIQQYLVLFFFEFFSISIQPLVEVFCTVLELISFNHKVFVEQSIFWISNSQIPNSLQLLYFNICTYILINYENLVNKKYLFITLTKINITEQWEPLLTKKIILLLGLIVRKRPRENVNALLNVIVEIDDGVPLTDEEYEQVKKIIGGQ